MAGQPTSYKVTYESPAPQQTTAAEFARYAGSVLKRQPQSSIRQGPLAVRRLPLHAIRHLVPSSASIEFLEVYAVSVVKVQSRNGWVTRFFAEYRARR